MQGHDVCKAGASRWRRSAARLSVAVAVASVAVPAAATVTYLGTRSIGAGTVDVSLETDGHSGVLDAADIVAWTVTLRDPPSASPLRVLTNDGAGGTLRSTVVIGGTAVSATPTALSFTYGLGDFGFDAVYSVRPFYQVVSDMCSVGGFGDYGACEEFDTGSDYYTQHVEYALHPSSGTIVLGTATAVPEPAMWILMVAGFGLVGTMRRRQAVVTA